ncbi:MFS transporter [Mailhella sp.]
MRGDIKRLFLGGLLTLLLAQLLYGALMLSALYKQYQHPVLQVNGLLCKNMADHLSLLVRAGKSLRPTTVEKFFAPFRGRTNVHNLAVIDKEGKVIYQWEKDSLELVSIPNDASQVFGPVRTFNAGGLIWLTSEVKDRKDATVSHMLVSIRQSAVLDQVIDASKEQVLTFGLITLAECLFFAFLLVSMARRKALGEEGKGKDGLRIRLCILLPLIFGQASFLLLLISPLTKLYQNESLESAYQVTRQITWDLERIVGMGMDVSEIRKMDDWLISRQTFMDSLGIAVYDENGTLHCATDRSHAVTPEAWDAIQTGKPLAQRDILNLVAGKPAGSVFVVVDPAAAVRNLRSMMLDNLTLTVVAALFLVELTYLLLMGGGSLLAMTSKPEFMRPVIFACLFGTEMSMSYVPIRIGELGLDLFGLPPDIVSGLPISSELFMAGVAMLIGGFWSQRSGWRPMLLSGILLASLGALLSWLATGPLVFILSRGVTGLGYGFINLSAQVFVIAHSPADRRAHNLAFMFAGLYAGSLCGSALGGLIADRLGYSAVYPATAILLLLLSALLWRSLPHEHWVPEKGVERFRLQEAFHFASDRRMGSLLFFFIIPSALITVCLFQFFIPLSLSQAGTSPADIGRVFLVYCIIVMFAGPVFGKIIDRAKNMKNPLLASILLAAVSVFCLLMLDGLPGAVCSVSILAVSTAIASNGQAAYALSLPAALSFGRSRTMGVYNVAMRIGQVLGPLSLGIMMAVWDTRFGLAVLTGFTLLCAFLFYALSWSRQDLLKDKR